ncbi:LarC family nickel insertion protein [Vannielia litorea]|uniref:LarC family nickel insertion protein n=1 Tax=Vannielia litorea TaxID=1217970 RepID=UPI001C9488EF|nr:LarC family nickel insertion protein [Vannielia litorea]MBY6153807.1 LarC family nickel insertion protein [Vannielia litorea]
MSRHVHIDAIGGLSGDMFAAAMLSAFPEARDTLIADLQDAGLSMHVTPRIDSIRKAGFAATQVVFDISSDAPPTHHWRDIRARLEGSELKPSVKATAIGIFTGLAEAEAASHGVPVDTVHFHEIADWDSLADIVAAASLIESAEAGSWSCSTLPLGRGRVDTQHGLIPVPAPATAHLLAGFCFVDDGVEGERITPTGAAILSFLAPTQNGPPPGMRLSGSGIGAGQRDLKGIPNVCRLLQFEPAAGEVDMVGQISFEIDDMTPEELSVALDHIRSGEGVMDAGYTVGYGKKSRIRYNVTVLAQASQLDEVAQLCLVETSTIGLRIETVRRRVLKREAGQADGLRTKTVARPGASTTKVESDDLAAIPTLAARRKAATGATDG